MKLLDHDRIKMLVDRERSQYTKARPKSRELFGKAEASLLKGVPMSWMHRWVGPYPIFVKEANGTHVTDVDGIRYLDLCLGDSGAMFGHSPETVVKAVANQMRKGITHLLPTEDSIWVGEDLTQRFGLRYWQVYMTASDANRFAIRIARQTTKRKLILVFDGCYHGSVEDTLVNYRRDRIMAESPDLASTTKVIQFNDLNALESALSPEDVACIICEPAMTDVGIIYPISGYHEALRDMTQKHGSLLIIDETHTICAGPRGLTGLWNLEPDILTLGKPIASGIPAAVMGLSEETHERFFDSKPPGQWDMGLGGTLSGNALVVAALRATLEHLMTEVNYEHMATLAEKMCSGVKKAIEKADLPWHIMRLGCRIEYRFRPTPPINGSEAIAANMVSPPKTELDELVHLYFANRNILISPFHNVMLVSPHVSVNDVDYHNEVFRDLVQDLVKE